MKKSILAFVALLIPVLVGTTDAQKPGTIEKITVEQIVARHLNSIGTPEDLKSVKSRVFIGEGSLVGKLGAAFALKGTAQLASQGDMVLYALIFDSNVYPYEKIAFNGKNQSFGLPSGRRTMLTDYFHAQNSILKEGLFTGVLANSWPLLGMKSGQKIKLENAGTATINERPSYKVRYSSSRTGNLRIFLYFDAETFRHLRTEYAYTIEPSIGTSPTDVRSRSRIERYNMQEDFSDFKTVGKLTLPSVYTISVTSEGQISTGTSSREWTVKILQAYFDEPLSEDAFKVS